MAERTVDLGFLGTPILRGLGDLEGGSVLQPPMGTEVCLCYICLSYEAFCTMSNAPLARVTLGYENPNS